MKAIAHHLWLVFLVPLVLAVTLVAITGCGEKAAQQWTCEFEEPSDLIFDPELISVNEGEGSIAALRRLPDDALWTATYAAPQPAQAPEYHQVAFDAKGDVVAVGSNTDTTQRPITGQLLVAKYDRDGTLLPGWPKFHSDPVYRWNEGQDVALDGAGNMAVAGYSIVGGRSWVFTLWMLDAEGMVLPGWPQYVASDKAYGTGVIFDSTGDIVACGASGPSGRDHILLAKYRKDGSAVEGWPRVLQPAPGQEAFSYDLMQDRDGNLVVAGFVGSASGGRDAVIYKLDADGEVLPGWPRTWDSGSGSFDEYFAVSQDAGGDYCIVGTCRGVDNNSGKLLVTRYGTGGEERPGWPQVYEREGVRNYSPPDAWRGSVDGAGSIACAFIAQSAALEVLTLRYASDGSLASGFPRTVASEGYLVGTRSCNVDGFNNIYTVGFSHRADDEDADHTTFIAKYPPAPYSTGRPSLVIAEGIAYSELKGFGETLGPDNEGGVAYQLSPDGEHWYFHDGSAWDRASGGSQANTAEEVDEAIADFARDARSGTLYIKALLVSDGSEKVQLDSISVEYD